MTLWLRLPIPPSLNAMFANSRNGSGRGRFKTGVYKDWLMEADIWITPPRARPEPLPAGPYGIEIKLPKKMRGDIDNRAKAVIDFLVSRGITPDDKFLHCLTLRRCPELDDGDCWVGIEELPT